MLVTEKAVRGGRRPIRDQSHRKVREGQQRYQGRLGRQSWLYKNLLYTFFFFSSEKHKGCEIVNGGIEKGAGSWGGGGSQERGWRKGRRLSPGVAVSYLHPLRAPERINMRCHSCFSSGDFIQSLQKLRIKCHGFVFGESNHPLRPKEGVLHTAEGTRGLKRLRSR